MNYKFGLQATASVVHNKQFAAAYGGMHVFRPMEIFYQAYIYI